MKEEILVSFCIPSFNRCFYLIDAIKDIIRQARDIHAENIIEICVSDNASTDGTKKELDLLKSDNSDIKFVFNFNKENEGPDRNFVKALSLPSGKYSILKGDDDYLCDGGLKYVINLLRINPKIDFFLSDVVMVDPNRRIIKKIDYLRESKEKLVVDFSNETEARSYFALCNCIHALGSFISGAIFNTDAVKGVKIDERFIGTSYAFEYYFWKYLLEGHLFMYSNKPYIEAVVGTSNVWSTGVKRNALDINSFAFIADYFFKDSPLKQDFLNVVNRTYDNYPYIPIDQRKDFRKYLQPALEKSSHPQKLNIIRRSHSSYLFLMFLLSLMPTCISNYLKKRLRRK